MWFSNSNCSPNKINHSTPRRRPGPSPTRRPRRPCRPGPLGLMMAGQRTARMLNAGGRNAGRQPFVRVNLGGDNILDPGESATVQLVFGQAVNPRRLIVLAGAF